jgi:hypothetical protein
LFPDPKGAAGKAPLAADGTSALDSGSDAVSIETTIDGCVKLYGGIGAAKLTVFCSRLADGVNLSRTERDEKD